jgi:hypothetical protein
MVQKADNKSENPFSPLPEIREQIDRYIINYASSRNVTNDPPNTEFSTCTAYISCYKKMDKFIGHIIFYDSEVVPKNEYFGSSPNYLAIINFHISRFNDIINILRNEELIFLHLNLNTLDGEISANGKVKG